ncbi:glycine betaine ABC transporter substrate-binding protein [Neomicrococcus aestuarii]|uniref:ABC-type glycine betaine transport system substrate-binding domain-containing protein n=1 Tax=Neomicrococcus aestuarii TaxID=556325 RepID=A0A1L2ZQ95_9MICC|nr:glycine betaine ABC transporter substrate-binding protein [Neomicrococcus aestuarii]APF41554.1 hypothetical protein BHE16_11790 [Neomicrococcus aestuarii]
MTRSSRAALLRGTVASCAVVLAVSGCTGTSSQPTPSPSDTLSVSVVSATSMVPQAMAELYAEALRHAGHTVTVPAESAGASTPEAAAKSVQSTGNTLALIPILDESGNLLAPQSSSSASATAPTDTVSDLALNTTNASDRQVVVMTAAESQETAVTSLEYAGPQCEGLSAAVSESLKVAEAFKESLESTYSCRVSTVNSLDTRRQLLSALLTDQIQLAVVPETDPSLYDNGLVILEDPRNLFPEQKVTPFLSEDLQETDIESIANRVSEKITENTMAELTRATTGDGAVSAQEAAREWLTAQGLVTADQ